MNENSTSFIRGRLRRLTDEEIELWLGVAKSIAPLPARAPRQLSRPKLENFAKELDQLGEEAPVEPQQARKEPPKASSADPAPVSGSNLSRSDAPARPAATPRLAPLERRLRQKLSRGRLAPDAAIDLHGMRSHEACIALRRFLLRAQIDGARLVLVVTGKGERGSAEEGAGGVLRRSVPQWLRGSEYQSVVVGFEEASRPHGGAGALYVRLRRLDRVRPERFDRR